MTSTPASSQAAHVVAQRLQRLYNTLAAENAEAYVALQRPNHLYFIISQEPVSDLPPVAAILFVPGETIVFPGAPFYYACRDFLPGYELAPTLVGAPDGRTQLIETLRARGYNRVIMDHNADLAETVRRELPNLDLVTDGGFGARLRRTKGPEEVVIMREAARISDIGMVAAFAAARPGATGRDIAAASAAAMLAAGAEDASLQVATGPATAYMGTGEWIATPRRVIQPGDMVLVDMAIRYHGYLGDQTRTAIVGDARPEQRALIDTVQQAYRATVAAIRPGATSPELYAITTDLLTSKGWRQYFPHHISHGLGLGGDLPRIADGSQDVLQSGDALSCEPGIYIPGVGGARFENMLLLTEQGVEELTQSPVDPVVGV